MVVEGSVKSDKMDPISRTKLGSEFFVGGKIGEVSGFNISGPFSAKVIRSDPNVAATNPASVRKRSPLVCEMPPESLS
jgi:hypothetical protein